MRQRLRRNSGFTLIELMVSIIIMTISGAALYYMYVQGQTMIIEEDHRRDGYELAQKRMASYKLLNDNDEIDPGTYTGSELLIPSEDQDDDDDESGITANYTVEITEEDLVYRVSIRYSWVELSGLENSVRVENYFPIKRDPLSQ